MKVKKDDLLEISHSRKGTFRAVALEDFDTDAVDYFPVAAAQHVEGMAEDWVAGEEIPVSYKLVSSVKIVEPDDDG